MGGRVARGVRIVGWGGAAGVLLVAGATTAAGAADWSAADFVIIASLLGAVGGALEVFARLSDDPRFRAGAVVAAGAALLLVWSTLAVGLIAPEGHAADLVILGVVVVGMTGAVATRFRAQILVTLAVAVAVLPVTLRGLAAGSGDPLRPVAELAAVSAFFAVLFLVAALLFRRATPRDGRARRPQ